MVNERVIERLRRGDWCTKCNNAEEVDHVKSPLIFDSNGINWETSLTERPEGV